MKCDVSLAVQLLCVLFFLQKTVVPEGKCVIYSMRVSGNEKLQQSDLDQTDFSYMQVGCGFVCDVRYVCSV